MPPKKSDDDVPLEIKQARICAEHDKHHKAVQKVAAKANLDPKAKKHMRAAFLKSKIWPANTTINVGFLNTNSPEDVPRTATAVLQKKVNNNGVALKLDPIQLEVDSMPVVNAIIYLVSKRFNDIIYPNYKPDSVTIDPNYVPTPLINIKFNFFDPSDPTNKTLFNPNLADIRIDFDPTGGAWSLLGTDCLTEPKTNQTMNFGWFDAPTTLHEFCHSLGMVHEHSNPNGKPIAWSTCHLTQWANSTQGWDAATINDNIIQKYKVDQINGSDFDPQSIMLYFFPGTVVCKLPDGTDAPNIDLPDVQKCFEGCGTNSSGAIACNANVDKCTRPGNGTSQNLRFSPLDVVYLNNIYPSNTSALSPEQLTVKFFNDVYGEQIDAAALTAQLNKTATREHALKDSGGSSSSDKAPPGHAQNPNTGDSSTPAASTAASTSLSLDSIVNMLNGFFGVTWTASYWMIALLVVALIIYKVFKI